jgi:hypothetical protein
MFRGHRLHLFQEFCQFSFFLSLGQSLYKSIKFEPILLINFLLQSNFLLLFFEFLFSYPFILLTKIDKFDHVSEKDPRNLKMS